MLRESGNGRPIPKLSVRRPVVRIGTGGAKILQTDYQITKSTGFACSTRHGSTHVIIIASSIDSNGTDGSRNFLLSAEISPLTEPAGPYQSAGMSQSMSIRERPRHAFLSRDRKMGQDAWHLDAFLSQVKTFCPGTERRDRTSRYPVKIGPCHQHRSNIDIDT